MKVLVFGAGVVGSILGGRLARSGARVTMLARGERLRQLRKHGVVLQGFRDRASSATPVEVTETLRPEDAYELVIVALRKQQVAAALPTLAANRGSSTILTMVNTTEGAEPWVDSIGRERLMLGFPGVGGAREGHVVRELVAPRWLQPTCMGELDGRSSARLRKMVALFEAAAIPAAARSDMAAWLTYHAAFVGSTVTALYAAGGDVKVLGRSRRLRRLMREAIRENLRGLEALGVPVTPRGMRAWSVVPAPLVDGLLGFLLRGRVGAEALQPHATVASDEMGVLATEVRSLVRRAGLPTPAGDELAAEVELRGTHRPQGAPFSLPTTSSSTTP